MGDSSNFGFGKFVPGFDFLKGLTQGTSSGMGQLPSLSNWIAPTVSVEELDKRIDELRAVQFWLEQNARALSATIQALQVQKMTLATLKGMNFNMGDVAHAFGSPSYPGASFNSPQGAAPAPATKQTHGGAPQENTADVAGNVGLENKKFARRHRHKSENLDAEAHKAREGTVDPMQWWSALTHQFQQIAANAMKDATPPPVAAQNLTAGQERKKRSPAPVKAHAKRAEKKAVKPVTARRISKKAATKTLQDPQPRAVV